MRIMFLILFLSVCFAHANQYTHEDTTTAVAIKTDIEDYNNSISIEATNFKELVQKSKLFIDNTFFIRKIVQLDGSTLILCPQSWGKTTLLTMLQAYLEIEVDAQGKVLPAESNKNYRLFHKGEIVLDDGTVQKLQDLLVIAEDEKLMEPYHGKYPVIYVTFKDTAGESYEVVKRKMVSAIGRAFRQHDYMVKVLEGQVLQNNSDLEKVHLERFKKYLNIDNQTNIVIEDVIFGLSYLSDILHHYFQMPSYILIDDYDVPIHSYLKYLNLPNKQVNEISHLLQYFLIESTTKRYHNQCVSSILMGTFEMAFNESYHNRTFNIMNNLQETRIHQYFGIQQAHVQVLFEKHNIDETLKQQALRWYNGYESKTAGRAFYDTKSIVHFLHHKKIACYRSPNRFINFVQKFIEFEPNQKNWILGSISRDLLQFDKSHANVIPFDLNFRTYLHDAVRKFDVFRYRKVLVKIFLAVLRTEIWPKETTQGPVYTLVNYEAAFTMAEWMISNYKQSYNITDEYLDNAATTLLNFIKTNSNNTELLIEHLQNLYTSTIYDIKENEQSEESPPHAILNCIALRMQCMSTFEMDIYYKSLKTADLVIHDHRTRRGQGIVIVLKKDPESAKLAYKNVLLLSDVIDSLPSKVRTVQLIGINVNPDKIVDILMTSYKI